MKPERHGESQNGRIAPHLSVSAHQELDVTRIAKTGSCFTSVMILIVELDDLVAPTDLSLN